MRRTNCVVKEIMVKQFFLQTAAAMEANAASNAAFATTAEFDPDPEFET